MYCYKACLRLLCNLKEKTNKCKLINNSRRVWSGNTTITNWRQTHGTARKSHTTITRHQEDKLCKPASSLFPMKMIAKLEGTKSNVQQNIEQLQTPTMGVTINNKSTTTDDYNLSSWRNTIIKLIHYDETLLCRINFPISINKTSLFSNVRDVGWYFSFFFFQIVK